MKRGHLKPNNSFGLTKNMAKLKNNVDEKKVSFRVNATAKDLTSCN
jgi:hypothetical protein